MKDLIIGIIIIFILFSVFLLGAKSNQLEVENRAKKIKQKECYTQTDIELITFGEPQL
jgi:thioredoxin-related protein